MKYCLAVVPVLGAVAAGLFLLAPNSRAVAADVPICMSKLTHGKAGGDREFILVVPAGKVADLEARGFAKTGCRGRPNVFPRVKQQMCDLAAQARSTPEIGEDFYRTYSVTPEEICNF